MSKRAFLLFMVLFFSSLPPALAQKTGKLVYLIQNIYGPNGLIVDSEVVNLDGTTHNAHFNSDFQKEFQEFNTALAGQLTSLPVPSPAAGFTYTLDPSTGLQQRSTQSFGPILSERSETIGKNKLSFGLNYQQFTFNSLEGMNLSDFAVTYRHEDYQLGGGRTDVVTSENSLDASTSLVTAFLTYGVTNRIDISLAVPMVHTRLSMISNATIVRIGTANDPKVHFFRDPAIPGGGYGTHRQFSSSGSATGLGDLIVRVKGNAIRKESLGVAFALDVRAPTGDELNLLGSGAVGLRPTVAMSYLFKRISPHVNLAYQWNGKSLLAGDLSTQKGNLPDQFLYVVGMDAGVSRKLTLVFDFLGQRVLNSPRLGQTNFLGADGNLYPDFEARFGSFNVNSGSAGFKTNVTGRLLLNFNLQFRVNEAGLHDKVSPLIGMEYSF